MDTDQSLQEARGGEGKSASILDRLSFLILLGLLFLLPIFFVPSLSVPFQFTKSILLSVATLSAFLLWLFARLREGIVSFPRLYLMPAGGLVLLVTTIAALSSGSVGVSLIGEGFETQTALGLSVLILLAFLVASLFGRERSILFAFAAFLAGASLMALFHITRLIGGPDILSFGIFNDVTSNVLGKWNEVAIFFGAVLTFALVTIEFSPGSALLNVIGRIALVVSLAFLAMVNFVTIWYVVGVIALAFVVYSVSIRRFRSSVDESGPGQVSSLRKRRIPLGALTVLIISLVFIMDAAFAPDGSSGYLGDRISSGLSVFQIEARPSWSATLAIGKEVLKEDPLFGVGPNRFLTSWLRYKPNGVNETIFWNTNFNNAVGFIPTFLVTTGGVGILALALFLALFAVSGFRVVLSAGLPDTARFLLGGSFFTALFLWVSIILYVPTATLIALTFFFTGLFVAAGVATGTVERRTALFSRSARTGFISVLCLSLLMIASISFAYTLLQRYMAGVELQRAVVASNLRGDMDAAEAAVRRGLRFAKTDALYRFLTEVNLIRLRELFASAASNPIPDTFQTKFQSLLGEAIENSRLALVVNSDNYENWLMRGRVYESVVPLGIQGAYEAARLSYDEAVARNPHSPFVHLTIARLEVAKKDTARAREYIAKALEKKRNYTEAIFLLSQIEVDDGNVQQAIRSVEAAATLAPQDPVVFFQLGLLRYNNRENRAAVEAFEKAVLLNSSYANAKYFLGLSYSRIGRSEEAIAQFRDLSVTNPNSTEVKNILANLEAGRSPFSNVRAPSDDRPERRSELPLQEEDARQ
ncbi:MAG: Tfp pilus assembly protein PilF [Parcubacteria group bacterium Gr01-1014_72]|nr:MAG: Tfp pilus assembly protein PilF [Parcubacteria group bacterium Gr01-1014_72]